MRYKIYKQFEKKLNGGKVAIYTGTVNDLRSGDVSELNIRSNTK